MKRAALITTALALTGVGTIGCVPADTGALVYGVGGANGAGGAVANGTGGETADGTGGKGTGGEITEGTGGMIPGQGSGGARDAGGDVRTDAAPPGSGGRGSGGMAMGTGGAAMGSGGAGGMTDVANALNGFMLLGPCLADTQAAVCSTYARTCPAANANDPALSGVLTTDKTITLGGTTGTSYTITLHIQGEVESKQYGGMDQNSTAQSPKADGFCVGGSPVNGDAYNVYMIRVTNPGATTKTDYFLNSLQGPGVSNHTTYGIDYTASIKAQGGATIRLVAADKNCSMIKNCGPTQNDGNTCAAPIILSNIEADAKTLNPTFDFTKAYNGQWIVMTVKGVTSP